MRRRWQTWLIFSLCLLGVFGTMAWVSKTALDLDRQRCEATLQAQLEENVRLSLWRMDSAVSTLLARESARSPLEYRSFYPAGKSYGDPVSSAPPPKVMLASPLMTERPRHVLLYFELTQDGEFVSPNCPTGRWRKVAETSVMSTTGIEESQKLLNEISRVVDRPAVLQKLKGYTITESLQRQESPGSSAVAQDDGRKQKEWQLKFVAQQNIRSESEWRMRGQTNRPVDNLRTLPQEQVLAMWGASDGQMRAIWVKGELLLARKVLVDKKLLVQCCWLEWPGVRMDLLRLIKDLLPNASLGPSAEVPTAKAERLLASLPVRLHPGGIQPEKMFTPSPVLLTLVVAWGCFLLAAAAVALVLRGAVGLSDKRGAFVSAVSHELRTPLTTFHMYSEMLENDMITDVDKRKLYLRTLRTEAERLGHMVENVLAYSRLESGHGRRNIEKTTVGELVDRTEETLAGRSRQAGMELVVDLDESDREIRLLADPITVQQILFNLVDNACKYGANAEDREISLKAGRTKGQVFISICDHGPGIPPKETRRLFEPFTKSAKDAANSAPGVGLGLALCRRLAREMKGDLVLNQDAPGTTRFILKLPGT